MLSRQMKKWADLYLTGLDLIECTIQAGYGVNSKRDYLLRKGSQLKKNKEIKAYINKRLDEKDDSILIPQNEFLKYLSDCVRGKIIEKRIINYRDSYEIIDIQISNKDRLEAGKLLFKYFDLEGKGKNETNDKPILYDDVIPNDIKEEVEELEDLTDE